MDNYEAGKRALDDDSRNEASNRKKLKIDVDLLPPLENIQRIKDPRKWNLLPSVVYELLALFKKSEKSESCDDVHMNEEQVNEKVSDTETELTLLPDENCNEKLSTNFVNTIESAKELDKFKVFKSDIENSIQNLKFDFFNDAEKNFEVPNNVSSNTETALINIEKCKQTKQKEEVKKETNLSYSTFNIMSTSEIIQSTSTTTYNMPVSTSEFIMTTKASTIMTSSTPINVSCTSTSIKTISDRPVSTKSVSNECHILGVPIDVFIPVTSSFGISSTTNNTISSKPLESVAINNSQNDVLKEKNLVMAFKSKETHDLLKNLCFKEILEVPATTPPPCICRYCIHVDNLPKEKSAINNQFTKIINNPNLHSDMYSSDIATSDCTETHKDIWINELSSLIRKNEEMYKAPKHDKNTSRSLTTIKNVMTKVAKQIKPHFPFCNICKKSKRYDSSICVDCVPRYKKPDRYKSHSCSRH